MLHDMSEKHLSYEMKWNEMKWRGFQAMILYCKGVHIAQWITWAKEMSFVMNHIQGAESIDQSVDLQSISLPLCYGCPIHAKRT